MPIDGKMREQTKYEILNKFYNILIKICPKQVQICNVRRELFYIFSVITIDLCFWS